MSQDATHLSRLQNWMQAVITHPQGVSAGVDCEIARQNLDLSFAELETLVAPSTWLSGAERLAIYGRAYYARLTDCFRAEFPCLLYALGDELFTQFVKAYLRQHEPRSYTLHHLAEHFPKFLAETRPDADAPPDKRESWPDFLIDLATLERAFVETYDGQGAEGLPLVSALQILGSRDEQLMGERLVPVPCLRVLAFRYPVRAYFAAVRQNRKPPLPAPADSFLAISRKDYIVRFLDLSPAQYEILKGLLANLAVGQAAIQAAQATGHPVDLMNLQLRDWLCQWANSGLFLAETDAVACL
jgi:hypothetical protein